MSSIFPVVILPDMLQLKFKCRKLKERGKNTFGSKNLSKNHRYKKRPNYLQIVAFGSLTSSRIKHYSTNTIIFFPAKHFQPKLTKAIPVYREENTEKLTPHREKSWRKAIFVLCISMKLFSTAKDYKSFGLLLHRPADPNFFEKRWKLPVFEFEREEHIVKVRTQWTKFRQNHQ